MKIVHIAGTRPNFVKIASIIQACNESGFIQSYLVHTGQHYSPKMSHDFFDELCIPQPNINLEVGSSTHAIQTADIMKKLEPVLIKEAPDAVLTVGDVNSTMAAALVASKLGINTIHVEAGLRSFDRTMPEEINRLVTDSISDILFVSEPSGLSNLKNEGIPNDKMFFVGNVMIDTLENNREKAMLSNILNRFNLKSENYVLVTLHRPSNVDSYKNISTILDSFDHVLNDFPIIFPIHPRTKNNFESLGLMDRINNMKGLQLVEPQGYLDFLKLMSEAKLIMTDSGGIQEESTVLNVPCLTLRDNTERPITITEGTAELVGFNKSKIIKGYKKFTTTTQKKQRPKNWDGQASKRIVEILNKIF